MFACHIAPADEALHAAVQRLPDRHQALVLPGRGLRQEVFQSRQGALRLLHAAADQQGAGIEENQVRCAFQQIHRHLFAPTVEGLHIAPLEQPVRPQAIHIVDGHVRMSGAQCQLDGVIEEAQPFEEAAGIQAQATDRRGNRGAEQGVGHGGEHAVPLAGLVERLEERLRLQQFVEQLLPVQFVPEFGAERGGEARQMRQADQQVALLFVHARYQFMFEIVAQPVQAGMGAAAMRAEQQFAARAPTECLLPDFLCDLAGGRRSVQRDHCIEFFAAEGQHIRSQFEQFVLHQQARQVPRRALPAADPYLQRGTRLHQQAVDQVIEFTAGFGRIVVENKTRGVGQ
ncbi:hypothetical protein D3C78_541020 [compost metagenome]